MKVTRFAALTALLALAGACHSAVPTESAVDAPAGPAFDGTSTLGSGNFAPNDDEITTTSSTDSTGVQPGDDERGGNGLGSGN